MGVQVRIPTVLRAHTGGEAVVSFDGGTIGEVLGAAVAAHPGLSGQVLSEDGGQHKFVNIYLNDDDVRYLDGLECLAQGRPGAKAEVEHQALRTVAEQVAARGTALARCRTLAAEDEELHRVA